MWNAIKEIVFIILIWKMKKKQHHKNMNTAIIPCRNEVIINRIIFVQQEKVLYRNYQTIS